MGELRAILMAAGLDAFCVLKVWKKRSELPTDELRYMAILYFFCACNPVTKKLD